MARQDNRLHSEDFRVISGEAENDRRYARSRRRWDYYTRTLVEAASPLHVDIELTNKCDLKCPFCERYAMKRKKGFMSLELFQQIIDECHLIGVDSVKLNLWGESLLHPMIADMISYAKKNSSLILQFNTNANQLNASLSRRFVKDGLDRLTISLDSMNADVYRRLRVGGQLQRVMNNIESLMQIRESCGAIAPHVTIQMIRTKENNDEVCSFTEYWEKRVDRVAVTNICTTLDQNILHYSQREEKKVGRKPCEQLWQRLSVLWDGTVTVCCRDYDGVLQIGSLKENALADLWKCDAIRKLRASHMGCNFGGLVCDKCSKSYVFSSREDPDD